jgi:hypothetical protein
VRLADEQEPGARERTASALDRVRLEPELRKRVFGDRGCEL